MFDQKWKVASAIILTLFALLGTTYGFVKTVAFASDVERIEVAQATIQKTMPLEMQIQLNKQTVRDLKGKVVDIEENPKKTQQDLIRRDRFVREIAEINRETSNLERMKLDIEKKR